MQPTKIKIKCHSCGAGYAVDCAKLPPTVNHFKCLKCGHPVPLLARLLASGKPRDVPAASAMKDPVATAKHDQGAVSTFEWIDRGNGPNGLDPLEALSAERDKADPWLPLYGGFTVVLVLVLVLAIAISGSDRDRSRVVMDAVKRAFGAARSAPIEKTRESRSDKARPEFQQPGGDRTPGIGQPQRASLSDDRCLGVRFFSNQASPPAPPPYHQQSIELNAITSYAADSAGMGLGQHRTQRSGLAVRSVVP